MKRAAPVASLSSTATGAERGRYALSLYVVGTTPSSSRAIVNVRKLCEEHLAGCYDLEVVDLSVDPSAAKSAQIVAAPTLVKQLPPPVRRFIGDMSNAERILTGLDVTRVRIAGST